MLILGIILSCSGSRFHGSEIHGLEENSVQGALGFVVAPLPRAVGLGEVEDKEKEPSPLPGCGCSASWGTARKH